MTSASAPAPPLVLVAVGTDHHPFDRLVAWADRWSSDRGADHARVVVQYGSSTPPTVAVGHALLSHEGLQEAMSEAEVVVCHGGPATITEARRHGHVPICVPRDPTQGEHVDNHQQLFARRMGTAGMVALAEDEDAFRADLDRALAEPAAFAVASGPSGGGPPGTRALGEIVVGLVGANELPTDSPVGPATAVEQLPPVTVLFVAGLGRSGSTLIERLVSQLPGHVGVGETVHLWQRSLVDDELCGCGEPFSSCPFWTEVGAIAWGGWDTVDAREVLALKQSVDRTRFTPALIGPHSHGFDERLTRYNALLGRLYRAVQSVSGARVVVDASKHGSLLHVLRANPDVDLKVLHVVRDSPAVAYSWTKTVPRPESTGTLDLMSTWHPARTSRQWVAENALVEAGRARGVPTLRLRYEDFTADPAGALASVQQFLGGDGASAAIDFVDGDTVDLHPSHTVAGNPMRFRTGEVRVREDRDWEDRLPRRDRVLVEVVTAPLRWRYGYLGRRR